MGNNEGGHTAQSLIKASKRRKHHKIIKRSYLLACISIVVMLALATMTFASNVTGEGELMGTAFTVLEVLIALIGGGLALWGIVNLLEGYGNDNPGAKSQGMKQLMAGAGVILIAVLLVPALQTFFNANY